MAVKFIQQDATTLHAAYQERKAEYDALRAAGRWSGAVLHAGTLLELALKVVMCKHLGITNLPTIFQVHDLDLLLCCSGQQSRFGAGTAIYRRSKTIGRWHCVTKAPLNRNKIRMIVIRHSLILHMVY